MTDYVVTLKAITMLAKEMERLGNIDDAESLYYIALDEADKHYGPLAVETGLIILELIDFYERQGRDEESLGMEIRVRNIIFSAYESRN